jgi:hypothetical protein
VAAMTTPLPRLRSELPSSAHRRLPNGWLNNDVLGTFATLHDLVATLVSNTAEADQVARALLTLPATESDRVAATLLVAARHELLTFRPQAHRSPVLDELAMVVAEVVAGASPITTNWAVLSVIVRRSWDRLKATNRRDEAASSAIVHRHDVDDSAELVVNQIAIREFRARLTDSGLAEVFDEANRRANGQPAAMERHKFRRLANQLKPMLVDAGLVA